MQQEKATERYTISSEMGGFIDTRKMEYKASFSAVKSAKL